MAVSTAGSTVSAAVPESSDAGSVALMVDTPGSSPVASPALEMEASEPWSEDHVTELVRSWVVPSEYRPVALNCWVWPWATEASAGVTVTAVSTAGSTVNAAVPESSDDGSVALMVDTPGSRPVASPWVPTALEMEASEPWSEDHVTELVRSWVVPSEYRPVAANCSDCPLATDANDGDTVTAVSTAGSTVNAAVPEMSDDGSVAVMVAPPTPAAVALPCDPALLETVATELEDDDHVTELVRSAVLRSE